MPLESLDLESLSRLDNGRIASAVNMELQRAIADCKDRPGLEKVRKVTITVSMKPSALDEMSDVEDVDVQTEVKLAIPPRKTKTYKMQESGGQLLFREDSHDDPRQSTLEDHLGPKASGE